MKNFWFYFIAFITIFIIFPLYKMFFEIDSKQFFQYGKAQYGIVFGAAIRTQGKLSPTLKNRMDDAIWLYKRKRIGALILSGSKSHQMAPGEPMAMRNYAITKGVRKRDIVLDERGDNTYLSLKNIASLKQKFPHSSIVYISSRWHIPRIELLSSMIGMKDFKIFYRRRKIRWNTLFQKSIGREILALWSYIFFYPFYKVDEFFVHLRI
jgi:vancomycin permeability regulator SanA